MKNGGKSAFLGPLYRDPRSSAGIVCGAQVMQESDDDGSGTLEFTELQNLLRLLGFCPATLENPSIFYYLWAATAAKKFKKKAKSYTTFQKKLGNGSIF